MLVLRIYIVMTLKIHKIQQAKTQRNVKENNIEEDLKEMKV